MTAAVRINRAAPMTVARGGREGAPIPVTPTFSARNAFTPKEARYGKAMNTGVSPLIRDIQIGPRKPAASPVATNFLNPDRAQFMSRIKIDVPYTGKILQSQPRREIGSEKPIHSQTAPLKVDKAPLTDKAIRKTQALEMLKGKNTITLFERPKTLTQATGVTKVAEQVMQKDITNITVKKSAEFRTIARPEVVPTLKPKITRAPSLSEIGLKVVKAEKPAVPVLQEQKPSIPTETPREHIKELRRIEIVKTDTSLMQVRDAIKHITAPAVEPVVQVPLAEIARVNVSQPEIVRPSITKSENQTRPARKLSPLDKIQERVTRKETPKPYVSILKNNDRAREVVKSIKAPKMTDKDNEKGILTQYVDMHILQVNNSVVQTPLQIERNKEIKKRMVSYLTSPEKKDPGSQLESQVLGDTGTTSEQVALKKIEALVKETRVAIQIAKLRGEDVTIAEKNALSILHTRIQESGLLATFIKIKETVTEDVIANPTETTKDTTAQKMLGKNPGTDEEEGNTKKDDKKHSIKIELDTFADRFRRAFMKMRAHRAFEKAKEKGRKQITSSEIAKEIGTYQYQFMKSEPVRYTKQPDGSITETLADLNRTNHIVSSVDEAERLIDMQITQKAPVRITPKIKTQPRGLLDLIRVLGYPQELVEKQQLAA